MRLNRNVERLRRRRARRQQLEDAAEAICSADSEREVRTHVSLKQRKDHVFVPERESRVLQQHEVRVKHETHVLMALKREARALSISEHEAHVSKKPDGRVSTQRDVRVLIKKLETHVQLKSPHPRGSRLVPQTFPQGT